MSVCKHGFRSSFISWFSTLISCSPNLPRVYIRLCKHGNHFTFLHSPSSTSCGAIILVRVFRGDAAFDKFRYDYIYTVKQSNNNHSFNKQEEGNYML